MLFQLVSLCIFCLNLVITLCVIAVVLCQVQKCILFLFCSLLHSDRDAIPEVPAIYFVLPTEENVKRICQVGNVFTLVQNFILSTDSQCLI